jgi:hypothetical protein
MHAIHEALTLHSPVAHPGSPWLTLLARCECLKRHGVGEREGELGADLCCQENAAMFWIAATRSHDHKNKQSSFAIQLGRFMILCVDCNKV